VVDRYSDRCKIYLREQREVYELLLNNNLRVGLTMDYFLSGVMFITGCLLSFAGGLLVAKNMLEVTV
jgi:hypothetical protein